MSSTAERAVREARRRRHAVAIMSDGFIVANRIAQKWVRDGWHKPRDIVAVVRP